MKDITNRSSNDLGENTRRVVTTSSGDGKVPSVVVQGRIKFDTNDPSKYCKKRRREMMQVVGQHGLDNVAKGLLPQVKTPVRRRIIASALDKCDAEARREVLNKSKNKNADKPANDIEHGKYSPVYSSKSYTTVYHSFSI